MSERDIIYLDNNASTPIDPKVVEAMLPYLTTHYGNPSSTHSLGRTANQAVDLARDRVARLLGCSAEEIVFTSGGTEANNQAIRGVCFAQSNRGRHIVTTTVEHPAVEQVCRDLERFEFTTTRIGVDREGRVDPKDIEQAVTDSTILISVMHANNEVGTIQPIEEISQLCRAKGRLIHIDAAQSVGKIPTKVNDLGVDLLSIAGHKVYAPKGVGALYIRKGTDLRRFMDGAGHESGQRAGTEAVAQIVALGRACELAETTLETRATTMKNLRDLLEQGILKRIPDAKVQGHREHRLPNTLSVSFSGMNGQAVLRDLEDVLAASTSSACHAAGVTKSAVLDAMQVPDEEAMGTLRLSVGSQNTVPEIERAIVAITDAVLARASRPG